MIVRLVKPGTRVKRGDLLIEFDRQAQIKTAHDRQAEYRDFVEQINKKRGEQITARAHGEAELKTAENAVKSAELEILKAEVVPPITAEQNRLTLDEARAKATQLRRTFDLRRKADAADIRALEIQRDRAMNAWKHAESERREDARRRADRRHGGAQVDVEERHHGRSAGRRGGPFGPRHPGRHRPVGDARARQGQSGRRLSASRRRSRRASRSTRIPTRTFTGRLEQLSPIGAVSQMSNRVRTFLAVFSIDGSDPHLMPDLAAAIDIGARPDEGAAVKATR